MVTVVACVRSFPLVAMLEVYITFPSANCPVHFDEKHRILLYESLVHLLGEALSYQLERDHVCR